MFTCCDGSTVDAMPQRKQITLYTPKATATGSKYLFKMPQNRTITKCAYSMERSNESTSVVAQQLRRNRLPLIPVDTLKNVVASQSTSAVTGLGA